MKAVLSALALLALSAAPVLAGDEEAAIGATLDALHGAAAQADGAAYFALFTPDARFIGTDATERWSLAEFRAYAEPYFDRGQGWTYAPRDRVITVAPIDCRCVAWFDEALDNASYGETRGSGVLRLTEDGWKIEQYVLSFAVPNDAAEDVVDVIRWYGVNWAEVADEAARDAALAAQEADAAREAAEAASRRVTPED